MAQNTAETERGQKGNGLHKRESITPQVHAWTAIGYTRGSACDMTSREKRSKKNMARSGAKTEKEKEKEKGKEGKEDNIDAGRRATRHRRGCRKNGKEKTQRGQARLTKGIGK